MLRMICVKKSHNRKTGNIPQTYRGMGAEGDTCPDCCPLKGNGCYAEDIYTKLIARRAAKTTRMDAATIVDFVQNIPKDSKFRSHVTGDFFKKGSKLDIAYMRSFREALKRRADVLSWVYTHAKGTALAKLLEFFANTKNLVINVSCDSLTEAVTNFRKGRNTSVVVAENFPDSSKIGSVEFKVCQAQINPKITCAQCQLCAMQGRKYVVAFRAHGSRRRQIKTEQ